MLEEALEVTIASGAPILHGIALRFEHKNLHFVINDFILELLKLQESDDDERRTVDDKLASLQPLLQSLPSSSVKTLTLHEPKDSKTIFECDSTLSDCVNDYKVVQCLTCRRSRKRVSAWCSRPITLHCKPTFGTFHAL